VHGTSALRRLTAAAAVVALTAGLAGCADSPEPTGGLAIVVGARSNMPPPGLTGLAVQAREEALVSQAYLSVVVADGEPFEMEGAGVLVARDDNSVIQERDRDRNRQMIDEKLATARAETPETDLLGALDLAARGISAAPGNHTIVVLDSGLSTVEALDFRTPGLLDADPVELAESLWRAGELPDLTGLRVVFQGLGDTAAPQEAPRRPHRQSLIDIWVAIANAAGAQTVDVEESPLSGTPDPSLPPVSPVPFEDGLSCTADTLVLRGGDVAFLPESADFRDPEAARSVVGPIAELLLSGQASARLTGTTADVGDDEGQKDLSKSRALAVRDLLVVSGVPEERLSVVGLGSDFPGYLPDHDAAGHLIPEAASQNRKVIVTVEGVGAAFCS
jgi:outer membrane protein OmpA-like peptidoglycan-associated protein